MIMPTTIEDHFFAPCGMNCMVCYAHLRNKKPCHGCLGDNENKPESCKKCKIKHCCEGKSISYCFECSEYPCKRIKNLERRYTTRYGESLMNNSLAVKQKGLKRFLQEESAKWTCTACSGVISLHDKTCSECGIDIRL